MDVIVIKSSDAAGIRPYLEKLRVPREQSHKGQNGKLLVVGGSQLFHAASIWAAEVASHFVDMVHYCSTEDNNETMKNLKGAFRNGIVVSRGLVKDYAKEDDAILIGPGMVREGEESNVTRDLTEEFLKEFPEKKFVFDAGALQMMAPAWLKRMQTKPIVTPHLLEYQNLFGQDISKLSIEEKARAVTDTARAYNSVILLKAIVDIISDGKHTIIVEGGNAGLTKGGTGDILAGLVAALYTKNDPVVSAVIASYILKRSADLLFTRKGTWYNNSNLIEIIPDTLNRLV